MYMHWCIHIIDQILLATKKKEAVDMPEKRDFTKAIMLTDSWQNGSFVLSVAVRGPESIPDPRKTLLVDYRPDRWQ